MTDAGAISIPVVAATTARPFEPRDIAKLNDSIVRLDVIDGETPWHHHRDDELSCAGREGSASRSTVAMSSKCGLATCSSCAAEWNTKWRRPNAP